jgi:hypothetical protein
MSVALNHAERICLPHWFAICAWSEPCVLEQACIVGDGEFAEAAIQAKVRRLAADGFVYHWLL